jgi:hypothetical protein
VSAAPTTKATAPRATVVRATAAKATAKVTVKCQSAGGCRVTLKLTARKGTKSVTVGAATATVTGQRTITVRLNATGRALLHGKRKLPVRLTATQDGKALGAARALTLR